MRACVCNKKSAFTPQIQIEVFLKKKIRRNLLGEERFLADVIVAHDWSISTLAVIIGYKEKSSFEL